MELINYFNVSEYGGVTYYSAIVRALKVSLELRA